MFADVSSWFSSTIDYKASPGQELKQFYKALKSFNRLPETKEKYMAYPSLNNIGMFNQIIRHKTGFKFCFLSGIYNGNIGVQFIKEGKHQDALLFTELSILYLCLASKINPDPKVKCYLYHENLYLIILLFF